MTVPLVEFNNKAAQAVAAVSCGFVEYLESTLSERSKDMIRVCTGALPSVFNVLPCVSYIVGRVPNELYVYM
jgi:hypothetical protein